MKKIVLLVFTCHLLVQVAFAQENSVPNNTYSRPATNMPEDHKPFKDRLFFGGDIGLSFGDVTFINLQPVVGYKFTDKFGAGLGPSYSYVKDNRRGADYKINAYGGRIFAQYHVIPQAMAYTEFNLINSDVFDDFSYRWKRVNIPAFLVGGGYVEPISESSTLMLMVLWDLENSPYSYTANPIIRVGINIGF